MSINQINSSNTFGMLITAVSAMIAVSNNFTDGPNVNTAATWTLTNTGYGLIVSGSSVLNTANAQILNAGFANIVSANIARINTSSANLTTINVVNGFITSLWGTEHHTANANVDTLLQVSDRANIFSANIQTANIGALSLVTLAVTELTVPVLNTSFANITTLSVTGTSQHLAVVATLVTTDNCNVIRLNASTANITQMTFGTVNTTASNTTTANVLVLNAGFANIVSANIASINTSTANITTATIVTALVTSANIVSQNSAFANIVSANIISINSSSVNITGGSISVTANPTTNLAVATKHYVDTGAGANLVNKLSFGAKGDLIPGSGENTFTTLTSGSNGQSLIVDTQTTSGLRWANTISQTFRGLSMGTSMASKNTNATTLTVYSLSEVVMDDGEVVRNWTTPTNIDISVSGAGGLDGGTANANSWYEVYAIRKRSDGTKNFIIHRTLTRLADQNTFSLFYPYTATTGYALNGSGNTTNYTRLAQSFVANVAGQLTSIEVRGFKTGAPAGNLWLTVEGNTAGIPNGTTLGTSRRFDVTRLQLTPTQNLKFIFDTAPTVNAATSYFWTLNMDNAVSATHFVNVAFSAANTDTFTNANNVNRGLPYGFSGTWQQLSSVGTLIYKTHVESNNNPVTMPAGYDQQCLISYVATDVFTKLKGFHQRDRTIMPYFTYAWAGFQHHLSANPEITDLQTVVPPISCIVSFLFFGHTVSTSSCVGRVHALDLPTNAIVEGGLSGNTDFTWVTIGGGTVSMPPSPPIWVEHQCLLTRITWSTAAKLYPCSITF